MLRSAANRLMRQSSQVYQAVRLFGADHPRVISAGEASLVEVLKQKFPKAKYIEVQDISGGCGAMYEIYVETLDFKGLNTIKQHRLVTEALKQQIKDMHGVRIHTKLPRDDE
ncbi:bolA-like protein 3 [Daphnia carinata]|uniref:bolA-like protein 3 n=1 Tax=Daphnia carinata TaxID=120202 RepID=UPI00257B0267|nr:bolA-like protein 3 [Daphnia carinata]XP_057368256.1 bolA-like protein 3 [Daphnia carinata]